MTMHFQTGDILTVSWDNRPIRVLQTDAIETFYDAEMEEVGWIIAKARTAIYYRTSTRFLEGSASVASSQPFSSTEEKSIDRICRCAFFGITTLIGPTNCQSSPL